MKNKPKSAMGADQQYSGEGVYIAHDRPWFHPRTPYGPPALPSVIPENKE